MNKQVSDTDGIFFGGLAWCENYDRHADERGKLQAFDFDRMPFTPCRSFIVRGAPTGTVRGGHMHRSGMQMLVCLHGCIEIMMRHRQEEITLKLSTDSPALIFRAGVWCQQKYIEENSILLVFASEPYTPDSYITHWEMTEKGRRGTTGITGSSSDE